MEKVLRNWCGEFIQSSLEIKMPALEYRFILENLNVPGDYICRNKEQTEAITKTGLVNSLKRFWSMDIYRGSNKNWRLIEVLTNQQQAGENPLWERSRYVSKASM